MYVEEKGPLVLSASLHLVALLALAITAMAAVEKKVDEDPPFDLYGDEVFAAPSEMVSAELPFEPIEKYESEDVELPTLEEIEVVTPEIFVYEELPEPAPEPEVVETPPAPKPKIISIEDFGPVKDPQNVPKKKPAPAREAKVELLDKTSLSKLSKTQIDLPSGTSQSMEAYYNSVVNSARSSIEIHPMKNLSVEISLDFSLWGTFSNIRVIRSSGDSEYDQKVVGAYRRVGRYPVKSPNGKGDTIEFTITQK